MRPGSPKNDNRDTCTYHFFCWLEVVGGSILPAWAEHLVLKTSTGDSECMSTHYSPLVPTRPLVDPKAWYGADLLGGPPLVSSQGEVPCKSNPLTCQLARPILIPMVLTQDNDDLCHTIIIGRGWLKRLLLQAT